MKKLNAVMDDIGSKGPFTAKVLANLCYFALPLMPSVRDKINETIERYVSYEKRKSRKYIRKLEKDMLFSRMNNQVTFDQYFLFSFEKLNSTGRNEYVGRYEKERYVNEFDDSSVTHMLFRDKYKTYEKFKPFYRRELIRVEKDDKRTFLDFTARHAVFLLKIMDESKGKGITLIDQSKETESMSALFDRLIKSGKTYIAEELIVQTDTMAALHPASVNTVRFVTYLKEDQVLPLFSFLRMGCGDSVIDNATSGGLAAAIDIETGIVTTPGCREDMTRFLKHPDSGIQIIGMQIPRWDELKKNVEQMAHVVPEQKFVGWDMALTDSGWVMVEGNDHAMISAIQMCEQKGLRQVFERVVKS